MKRIWILEIKGKYMDEFAQNSAVSNAIQSIPSSAELIAEARAMVPSLRERSEICEKDRQMPVETFEEYKNAGILNVSKPKEYGGYEYGWDVLCEISFELARGCGSSAWVYSVLAEHNQTVGTYPLEAQKDVWGADTDTFIASGNSPTNNLIRVNGGWEITGQLNYSSGCDFADWHLTGSAVGDKPMKILVPQSECEIVDNWHVLGLAGTGSKDIKMEKVFIPDHRTIEIGQPGPRFYDHPLFRMPQWSVNPYSLVAVIVGVALGALEMFVDSIKERESRFGDKISEFQSLQLRIAESSAEIDAAKRTMLGNLVETMEIMADAEELPIELRARNKRDMAYCPILAARAVERLFYAIGARGLFQSEPIQRSFRDVNAGMRQIALNWDVNGTTYGQIALGQDPGFVRW